MSSYNEKNEGKYRQFMLPLFFGRILFFPTCLVLFVARVSNFLSPAKLWNSKCNQVSSLSRRNRLKTLSSLDENLFVLFLLLWLWILLPPYLTSLCLKHPSLLCSCSTFSLLTSIVFLLSHRFWHWLCLSKCVKYSKEGRKSFRLLWFLVGFLDLASSSFLSLFSVIPFFLAK